MIRQAASRFPLARLVAPFGAGFGAVLALGTVVGGGHDGRADDQMAANVAAADGDDASAAPAAPAAALAGPVRLGATHVDGEGRLVADVGGAPVVLTREPALEAKLQKVLEDGRTPFAATVLIEIGTGRVLAVAEHSTEGPATGLAQTPLAPAASIFKLVTASALMEAGVSADAGVCFHGGKTRMNKSLLVDNARRDRTCTTLKNAVSMSQNVAVAKLALSRLDPSRLTAAADAYGFGKALPADIELGGTPSSANIPEDPFGFANAAAGFGDVKLSALHGALLAASIADGGVLTPARFVDDWGDVASPARVQTSRVVSPTVARSLRAMMKDAVDEGTARRTFQKGGRLPVSAAGKTGSLTDHSAGLDTSWFVGFAPAENPEVAVATVVVNRALWHVKAPYVAKEALRSYFSARPPVKKAAAVARR